MSTMADGTRILKSLGAGYYIAGPCRGAAFPETGPCRRLTTDDAVIWNHPVGPDSCIADMISASDAVARTYFAAGGNAVQDLSIRRFPAGPVEAAFQKDRGVLQLRLRFPEPSGSSYTVTMTDASGKEVFGLGFGTTGDGAQYFIDVQDLPKGRYRLQLSGGSGGKEIGAQDISLD